nr:hypothetical protein [Tanacetum cinerariifolium]
MVDQRTMAELLRAPTEGFVEAIVVPSILAEQFELKQSLINMMTSDQFFGLEKDKHDHIWAAHRWLEKEPPAFYSHLGGSCFKIYQCILSPSRTTNLRNEISNFQKRFDESFHEAWDRYKDLLHACPHHGFTELHQLDTFYNALNPTDQDSLNSAAGGNLLERLNQQISDVTTAMTAILKQFQATPPPAFVKSVEKICVTYGGAHLYYQCLAAGGNTFPEHRDNIQGYVAASVVNYKQGNSVYRPPEQSYQAPTQQKQVVPLSELEKVKRMNEANMKSMQTPINNVKNKLRNEMKNSIQASMSNQSNELKNMMASFFQINTASTSGSGSLPRNTIASPKGKLKAITTRSGIVLDGPSIPIPPTFINPEEDKRIEKTLTDQDLAKYTIKYHFFFSPNQLLEEFTDELALITFLPRNDDLPFDIESDLKEIEYLLHHDPIKNIDSILKDSVDQSNLADLNDNLVDSMPEMFTEEHALDYSSPPLYDEYDDDLFLVESETENVYDDPFDSKGEKVKESKLLIDELDLPSDSLHSFKYDLFLSENFSEVDALPLTNNEDKVFNPGILIQENFFEVITHVAPEKKLAISHASLILEDFDPPLYELSFFKEVPKSKTLLSFSSENKGKVFKPSQIL